MQHTENYNLNLFESGDPVLAENFNANAQILDSELAKRLYSKTIVYTGNGATRREFTFESQPLVLFFSEQFTDMYNRVGIAIRGSSCIYSIYKNPSNGVLQLSSTPISWTDNGFVVETDTPTNSLIEPFNFADKTFACTAILK